jgi:hypothetical protein
MEKKRLLRTVLVGSLISTMLLVGGWGYVPGVSATTPNTITVDCTVNVGTEWAADENMGTGGMGTSSQLFITWDAANLYVGVTTPTDAISVYIDTAPGGTEFGTDFELGVPTHPIANAGHGYEFAYSDVNPGYEYQTGSTGSWLNVPLPPGTDICGPFGGPGPDFELAVPWAVIGTDPGDRVTVLVTDRTDYDVVAEYWPDVAGNSNPPADFTQGIVLTAAMPGVSPNGSPTAITLDRATAASADVGLPFVVGAIVLGLGTGLAVVHRRRITE